MLSRYFITKITTMIHIGLFLSSFFNKKYEEHLFIDFSLVNLNYSQ